MNEIIFYEIEKEKWCEVKYLDTVISYLNEKITNYSIIVTPNQHSLPNTKYNKIIVILTGDETGQAKSFVVGEMIKEARKEANLTQDALAKRSGTKKSYISRLENGKIDIQVSTLFKIFEEGLGKRLGFTML